MAVVFIGLIIMDVGMVEKLQMKEVPKPAIFLKMEVMGVLIIAAIVLIGTAIIADQVTKLPIPAILSHAENISKHNAIKMQKNRLILEIYYMEILDQID